MAGKCRHCGLDPVPFDAKVCPKCGGADPVPAREPRLAEVDDERLARNRKMVVLLLVVFLAIVGVALTLG